MLFFLEHANKYAYQIQHTEILKMGNFQPWAKKLLIFVGQCNRSIKSGMGQYIVLQESYIILDPTGPHMMIFHFFL